MRLFEPIFEALETAKVRYVVVGGLATVLHGFARLTADVDLVVDLRPEPARDAIIALTGLGLVPRAPVDPLSFADVAQRTTWIEEKGMRVFSMSDPTEPMREVDLFVDPPIDFDTLWARSETVDLAHISVHIASISDLIAMKRLAGRPEDLLDIDALEEIRRRKDALRG